MKNSALAPAKTGDIYAMSAKKRRLRKCGTLLTRIIVYAAAALAVCILLLLIGYILVRGIPALNPVSYTHLDVYKRQGLSCTEKWA